MRWIGKVAGVASIVVALLALPAAASGYQTQLKRYPYLTDLVGSSVIVNWGTDISAQSAVVKWGQLGTESCNAHTTVATRTFIFVNGVSEYQWKAPITGLAPDTEYCYRVYFGASQLDLLGTDPTPSFRTQIPAGSTQPFKFAVWGDWGEVVDPSGQNPDQANLIARIAASGARFGVTTGDNASQVGSQKNYGDLYQTGENTSAVFGPSFWKAAGASMPLFPALGNHDHNNSNLLVNWPQDAAVSTSGGRYTTDTYCCLNGTNSSDYPSTWYAFDAGIARFYVLDAAWQNSNVGTANLYKNDYDNHWAPGTPQREWLENDLAANPRALRFAFFHFPPHSDQSGNSSDTYLQGAGSLEGLLEQHDVTVAFSGHSHNYQRNDAPPGGVPTTVSGGGGAHLESIGPAGCSAIDQYGIGWSGMSNTGSACGSAPVPDAKNRVHHFLLVSVNGTSVTVTPTDELGRTFDEVTYGPPAAGADLSLTKSDSPDPALAGELLTYTLEVDNGGPQDATGVQLTDTLPAGATFDSATPSQGSCSENAGTVSCSLGTIADEGVATVEIEVRPQSAGQITNEASVTSDLADADPADNSASAETTVDPAADLSLSKSDAPDPVLAGELLTYTLTVQNSGPQDATGVTLSDTLPAGVTFDSATPTQGSCSESGGTVDCALGTIADEAGASVEIQVTPQAPGTLTNEANVVSLTADPDSADNSASADTTVNAAADLSLSKADSPDPVPAGELLTYTLTVQNSGPQEATGVSLTDTLPVGVSFESATPSQGSCSEDGGTVDCALGTIADEAGASVEIEVTPQSAGTITNEASVSSEVADPDPADNSASADTTVDPVADLVLIKSGAPDPVLAGEQLTYTLEIANAGPQSATGVQLTDTLPAGVVFDSATSTQGSCSEDAGTVDCALGPIAGGLDAVVEIKVTPQSAGLITNQASVDSDVHDPSPANNSASAETTVNPVIGYPRPAGATPLRVSLVPAYVACTSPNRIHGPALEHPACNPPARASTYLTVGTPDSNGAGANSAGFVKLRVQINQSPDPHDVLITATITDVRCSAGVTACGTANSADGPDYTGELQATYELRITDKFSGTGGNTPATVTDTALPVTIACAQTASASIGGRCELSTSANSVVPGSVQSAKRAIWQLGPVQVLDGGPDGIAATSGNTLFATQGIFIP